MQDTATKPTSNTITSTAIATAVTKAKTGPEVINMKAQEAMQRLKEGNERFARGESTADKSVPRRQEVSKGQQPYATIIYCSDSRSPAEHIFDAGLGDIFGIRTAGNVTDKVSLGSIEYGAAHLHTPLIVVMGHSKCGAVTATCEGSHAEGNIKHIVKEIKPAVKAAKKTKPENLIEASVVENVLLQVGNMLEKSDVLRGLVEKGELQIIGAKYDLESGKVTFF